MLGWLCVLQSLVAYTPGILAGAERGAAAPSPSMDACSQPHKAVARCNGTNGCQCTDATAQMADDLYGGYAPATPFLSTIEVFRQSAAPPFS